MSALNAEEKKVFDQYKDAVWQVHPDESVSSNELKMSWDDMRLRPVNKTDFELTLINQEQSLSVRVVPVLSGKSLQKAMDEYKFNYKEYQKNLAVRDAQLESKKLALKNQMNKKRQLIFSDSSDSVLTEKTFSSRKVVNKFIVNSFGIWNCDRPYTQEGNVIHGNLKNNKSEVYGDLTAYLVNENRNSVVRFYATKESEFVINKDSKNMLWLVTEDQKLAVFKPEDFEALKKDAWTTDELSFVMEEVQQKFNSESELREILDL